MVKIFSTEAAELPWELELRETAISSIFADDPDDGWLNSGASPGLQMVSTVVKSGDYLDALVSVCSGHEQAGCVCEQWTTNDGNDHRAVLLVTSGQESGDAVENFGRRVLFMFCAHKVIAGCVVPLRLMIL